MTSVATTPFEFAPSPVGQNRRKTARTRIATVATATIDGVLVDAITVDLSTGGIQLVASRTPRVGAAANVVFFLNGELVAADGIVCWCAPRSSNGHVAFGVRFTKIEDDGATVVDRFSLSMLS